MKKFGLIIAAILLGILLSDCGGTDTGIDITDAGMDTDTDTDTDTDRNLKDMWECLICNQ